MITERELVWLPYPDELTKAGIVYARRALLHRRESATANRYDLVRRMIASGAANLAFRRYLTGRQIAFGVQKPAPFTDPDRYDVELGGRGCEVKVFLISRATEWRALVENPRLALDARALVPLDRHASETVRMLDMYVFAFVGARVASTGEAVAGPGVATPELWMHVLPQTWQQRRAGLSTGRLALEAGISEALHLDVGGQDRAGSPIELRLLLDHGHMQELPSSLLAVNHLCVLRRPSGPITIFSAAPRSRHVIGPGDWQNVWLDPLGIILVGWITRQEFRDRARLLPQGSKVFQFDRTKTKNLAMAVADLRPMETLPGTLQEAQISR